MDNGHEPATKADLLALELRLEQKVDQKLHEAIGALRNELVEVFRDTETRLLKAFYDFAESNQKRLLDNERESAGMKERLGFLERRVTDIEKRLNMPSP